MELSRIAEHLICLDILPKRACIADLGCLNFIFTNEMRRLGHDVYPVDIQLFDGYYHRVAITDHDGHGFVVDSSDKQATTFIKDNGMSKRKTENIIECKTLKTFMNGIRVNFFDYIKTDIEGSEKEMVMSLDKPPAKQIEIEFHLHTGVYGEAQVSEMVDKLLSLGYKIASHEKTSQHGLMPNYWSSLFVL